MYVGQILLSAVFLWKGAGWLVESSIRIARSLNVSPLVIGLTVVAFGTSAPEFAVTINAALSGQPDISVSNVIGSNIFNLGFILGGVAIVKGIKTDGKLVWRDGMVLIASTIAILYFIWDLHFSRKEGIIMFAGLGLYLFYLFIRKEKYEQIAEILPARPVDYLYLLGGIATVVLGGHLLKIGALSLARDFGVSEWIIGVTIVAAGTSAPEFVTSLVAAIKGHHGISAGNLIGSDLFNLLGVLGLAGILNPMTVTSYAHGSLVMLVGMVILVVIFMRTGWRLSRAEGFILVGLNALRWTMKFTTG
ncbi:MAG: calcium/sodium antiporter [FCB group bacterium]|nr:calcium/sodium antiporter [FCB group bacterium]